MYTMFTMYTCGQRFYIIADTFVLHKTGKFMIFSNLKIQKLHLAIP